jgi:Coenzyme PQQ synthesis protein D (PqqD)
MPIDLATCVTKSRDQVSCELNGEVAILNLKSTLYFGLNRVGATVWDAMNEPMTAADLCRVVLDRFDVTEVQCQTDVLELLTRLNNAGLIDILSPSPR